MSYACFAARATASSWSVIGGLRLLARLARWTAEWIAESWRVIARAAIDALGLTEEWRCIGWVSTSTEKTAWLQRQSNGGEVQARLVSPWVRKDSSDE